MRRQDPLAKRGHRPTQLPVVLAQLVAIATIAVAVAIATPAAAQPAMGGGMPNLAAIVGKALPDRGMPTGTVTVRVARKMPVNGVADTEVTAIVRNAGGDARKRTAKTDASGRALFEGLAPGDQFNAQVVVDGEKLTSETFTIPSEGGIRTMLIAALPPAPAGGQTGAGEGAGEGASDSEKAFVMGATVGVAVPEPMLPLGTLEVRVLDEAGAGVPNHKVVLGAAGKEGKINLRPGQTDANGTARFVDLPGGEGTGYAAVIEWRGMRLNTAPFVMPTQGGARADIRAMATTADPRVMTIGAGARVVVQMQDTRLEILEMLPLENSSDKIFDPGVGALEIPLPSGFVSAQGREGPHKIDVRPTHGVAVRGAFVSQRAVATDTARASGNEVQFGFVLPYYGNSHEFEQPMPNGIGPFTLITEQIPGLTVTGPGVGAREARELSGRKYWIMPVDAVPAGGKLTFTLHGLPAKDPTGRNIAGVLALALIVSAFVFGRRPPNARSNKAQGNDSPDERARLIDKREALFSALVTLERQARTASAFVESDRRKLLVSELEQVYKRLAGMDEQRAA